VPRVNEDIEWEEPTEPRNRKKTAFWEATEARPGEWAVYARDSKSAGGALAYLKGKGYDAVSRSNGDGTATVYARKRVRVEEP
jgi:hypothetical protein